MEIVLKSDKSKKKKKTERDFYWHDPFTNKSRNFRGGELKFRYIPSQRRMEPYTEDNEIFSEESNFDYISEWINKNLSKFDITVSSSVRKKFILINVSATDFDDITEELYRAKIAFDYDEGQLAAELRGGR